MGGAVAADALEAAAPRADGKTREDAFMNRRKLIRSIDTLRIENAIREAEKQTSGEICVSISLFFLGRIRSAAEKAFDRLGMSNTRDRNGILFFLVPSRRSFVVLGDEGIHAKVGQEFWESIAAAMSEHFRKGEFTEGLVKGIQEAGERLAVHFPYNPVEDINELSDKIDLGPAQE